MPNKILDRPNPKSLHSINGNAFATNNNKSKSNDIRTNQLDDLAASAKQSEGQSIMSNRELPTQQQTSILNVAEMLLHGVADNEILNTWLRSIACQDFASNFLSAGYDMPTISRITPQDLTAIGITDPAKRLKILGEIKKLNLQDGIPEFKPANLSHWLSLLRLDSQYFDLLCDQQIDTIEKMCQLTWEDFEELGITKLGHQKRLILAIERMKEINSNEDKKALKPMSEPIYDTNPSQILLVASAENHCMNGPIINKQSSTSELSSSGSGSMHSVYSANSIQHQSTYASMPPMQQHPDHNQNDKIKTPHHVQNQQQAIYSQPPSQMIHRAPHQQSNPQPPLIPPPAFNQQNHGSHYRTSQPVSSNSQPMNQIYDTTNLMKRNTMVPHSNRQSLGQLPFSALANLPKHQQQMLQQRSLYATLSRHPQRVKLPPPPVPVRTNSLTSNSLVDEETIEHHTMTSHKSSSQILGDCHTSSVGSLFRSGTRISNKTQINSHTLLTKNKSFSGNAYMDAARARFLTRNNYYDQQQHPSNPITHRVPFSINHDKSSLNEFTHGIETNFGKFIPSTGHLTLGGDNMSMYSRQSLASASSSVRSNTFNLRSSEIQAMRTHHQQQVQQQQLQQQQQQQRHSASMTTNLHAQSSVSNQVFADGDEYDPHSDTNSTKSLILQSDHITNSPVSGSRQMSLSQDSDSSQTIYNSASSGSNDRSVNGRNLSQSGDLASRQSIASNSTLNDVKLTLDQTVVHRQDDITEKIKAANLRMESDATTGMDDNFPPPPSPLSLTDSEENDLRPLNHDKNFADINNRLMAFRVGGI